MPDLYFFLEDSTKRITYLKSQLRTIKELQRRQPFILTPGQLMILNFKKRRL